MQASSTAHSVAVAVELGLAAATLVVLWRIVAPYGRHLRAGWGPTLSARLGWLLMETPAVVGFLAIYGAGRHALAFVPLVLAGMWQLHYLHRTFIFPFRLPASAKPIPWIVAVLGFAFNVLNAWINAWWIADLGSYAPSWLVDPRFVVGVTLFATGMAINLHADTILLNLRRGGAYAVPRGGLYRWISCPNYLGEMVEWTGWAVATWSPAGLAFALYTAANLLPRAVAHHRWYRESFEDYPSERRALIPHLL